MSTILNDSYLEVLQMLKHKKAIKIKDTFIKEIIHYTFFIDNISDNIIEIPGFETNLDYAKEELNWYLYGTKNINFSEKINKIWKKYSDDGINVNSNYGDIIFNDNINQWTFCINKFKKDINTRQAIININQIKHKSFFETKDFPCCIYIQMFIRNNNLVWIINFRSQDIYLGFRNDIYCFTEIMKLFILELEKENIYVSKNSKIIYICNSLHIYEKHFDKLNLI